MQNFTNTLEKDLQDSRDHVSRLTNQLNDGQDETLKNQNAKNKAEVVIVDLKQNTTLLKDDNIRLTNDLGQVQRDLAAQKTQNENLQT